MSQNLTQPEEIEHILIAMESRDMREGSPLSDGHPPGMTSQNTKCDGVEKATDVSCGAEHAKSIHGFCESHPYVWSM